MIGIEMKEDEDISSALRRFKQKCIKESIFRDIRRSVFYDKPSVRKRKKHVKALKRLSRNAQRYSDIETK